MADLRPPNSPNPLEIPSGGELARQTSGGAPPPYEFDEEDGLDLKRMLAAVLRHKWAILILTLAGTVGGVFAARLLPSEYVAQATIWIETSGQERQADVGPIRSQELLSASAWVDLLRSFVVLDHVVREERLFLRPQNPADSALLGSLTLRDRFLPGDYRIRINPQDRSYVLANAEGVRIESGSFGDSVGTDVGFEWQPDLSMFPEGRPVQFHVAVPRDESLRLSDRVQTRIDQTGNFLRLELRGQSPAKTASILNALAKRHVEVARDLKRAKLDELVSILDEQLAYAEENLREAEIALEDFKIQTITLPSERSTPVAPGIAMTRDPVFDNYFSMRVELEQLRRDRDALERALSGDDGVRVEALESIGPVQESSELTAALEELTEKRAELRALRYRYTDDHPPVRQLVGEIETLETVTIPQIGQALLDELEIQESRLEDTLGEASEELREIPPRAIEEARLERRVTIADNLYTTLQVYEEARLAAASTMPDVRILDEATIPQQPVSDRKLIIVLMGFAGSLGLGLVGAIVRDRLDPKLRYPEQVTDEMGLTILGGIPNLKARNVDTEKATEVLESFRTIRLNLIHAYGSAGPVTLTVSSPGPGDGKSFVSANLALSFSELGYRTLLLDGDIRKGSLHQLMETERKPGLTDYLDGGIDRDRLIRQTRFEGLQLISSGSRVRHGPELLGSKEMRELLLDIRADYDAIIVDSPPLGAGVDPFALGTLTGNMLLVLRSGITNREMAESRLVYLERLPIRLLGAVFNGVPKSPGYGYYGYVAGYGAWDEEEVREPLQVEANT